MLNKMPKESEKKIKSAHKRSILQIGLIVLAIIILLAVAYFFAISGKSNEQKTQTVKSTCTINLDNRCIDLERADTNSKRIQGLSDRTSMDTYKGMLFVFDVAQEQCFWMKDMHFSLDMVFVDNNKKIVKIDKNISPDTYPQDFCAEGVRYVIELNAGIADRAGLKIGQELAI
jgi:uncharacterized membrane protein (UPF0127 family)